MRHPLAASPRHWPQEAREALASFIEDKAAILEYYASYSRDEAEEEARRQGERAIRAAWAGTGVGGRGGSAGG